VARGAGSRNRRAFPYGGIELARLFDARQRPVGGIGGRPPASFGLRVRDAGGRVLLATQLAKRPGGTPLRLIAAPAGAGVRAGVGPPRACAGPFRGLRAAGTVAASGLRARTRHRFTPSFVETRWSVRGADVRRGVVDVLFPSWGPRSARVWAVDHDGRRFRVTARPARADRVAHLYVGSATAGYVVVPVGGQRVKVSTLRPDRQASAPNPGPTLSIRLSTLGRSASFAARLAPVSGAARAARVAAAL
jgi:hypothetical protein